MDIHVLRNLLKNVRTIAILGAKDSPGQPVDRVGRYLVKAGFDVIPVHPVRKNVWGLTTYASLRDIPQAVDLIDVFRAPQYCLEHAREALSLSPLPGIFWMQLGIRNEEAAELLREGGITVVQDACLLVEHSRL